MKLVVVGGHSRNVGKTSVAQGIIAATRELKWTAMKITQFGHGICSSRGSPCNCSVEDPDHPFAIARESDPNGHSDTSRLLRAGAQEVYWVRTKVGGLGEAMPALRRLLKGREYVLMESNSILRFLRPDLYFSVLKYDVADFKVSSHFYLGRADAFVVAASVAAEPTWERVNPADVRGRPTFAIHPPEYCPPELLSFLRHKLELSSLARVSTSHGF